MSKSIFLVVALLFSQALSASVELDIRFDRDERTRRKISLDVEKGMAYTVGGIFVVIRSQKEGRDSVALAVTVGKGGVSVQEEVALGFEEESSLVCGLEISAIKK